MTRTPATHHRGYAAMRAIGIAALLLVPSAIQTLPPAARMTTAVAPNGGDPLFITWTLASEAHSLAHHPTALFAANIFYPRRDAIAWSDNLLVLVPVFGAIEAATGGRMILAYNIVTLLGYAGVGLAVYLLATELLGDRAAAIVSATLVSLSMARSTDVGHTQLVGFLFVPLALVALLRFLRHRHWPAAVGLGLAAAATWLVTAYYTILLLLVVVPLVVVWLVHRRLRPGAGFVGGVAVAAAVAGVLVFATVVPYVRLQTSGLFSRSAVEQRGSSISDLLRVPPSLLWRALAGPRHRALYDRGGLFPGVVLSALVAFELAGLARDRWRSGGAGTGAQRPALSPARRSAPSPAWLLAPGALLCVGIVVGPRRPGGLSVVFDVLRRTVPGIDSLRDLYRFWIFPLLCLALLAGAGVRRLVQATRPRWRSLVVGALVAVAWVELLFRPPVVGVSAGAAATAANRLLRGLPAGAVLELPQPIGPQLPFVDAPRELRSLVDGDPRVDGYSGNTPPLTITVEHLGSRLPPRGLVPLMRRFGVRYFLLHGTPLACAAGYSPGELSAIVASLVRAPGVVALYRAGPDVVVVLAPDSIDRRLPEVPSGPPRPRRCG